MTKRAARSRNRRTETVAFRVSPQERERLEDGAIEAGMTLSAYLAALLDRRVTSLRARLAEMHEPQMHRSSQPEHRTLSPEVMTQLSRIGNNLNQIAHAMNSCLSPEPQHLVRQLQALVVGLPWQYAGADFAIDRQ